MEQENKNSNISKNWLRPILVILLLVVAGFFLNKERSGEDVADQRQPEVQAAVVTGVPDGFVRRLIDGVSIPEDEQATQLYAVMIENSAEAWPLSGLSEARLVIEALVEGSITRLMAIYDDTQEVLKIGPVRSARPYYLDWSLGFKAMYVHVGGSPEALGMIKSLQIPALNQFFWSQYFWRASGVYAPHNVYTSSDLISSGYEAREYDLNPVSAWEYVDQEPAIEARPASQIITVPFSSQSSQYDAVWKYDRDSNSYHRFQNKSQQFDREGPGVSAKNIIVIPTEISVIDSEGRRSVVTAATGKLAKLFKDGQTFNITWNKEDQDSPLYFESNGEPVLLNPGTTWIEVIPLSVDISVVQ